jgi:MoaA/NifB/PqqE/SkfB family radical SAM enzyme
MIISYYQAVMVVHRTIRHMILMRCQAGILIHCRGIMMEFMLSNTCNLECVMCSGELSSSIRKKRDKLPPIKTPYGQDFLRQLEEFIPYLKETRFSSAGEAFSIDMNYDLWEMIIEKNPSCKMVVQTNGTILNARVKDFLERGNFIIGVSLDSCRKDVYESIRLNASYVQVMSNSKRHNRMFTISSCVMRQNWQELPDFIKFCNGMGAYATFHKVWSPLEYALYNLPAAKLRGIYAELSAAILPADNRIERRNQEYYEYFISVIDSWARGAMARDTEAADFARLSASDMMIYVKSKIKTYIITNDMLENDKQQLIEICESKLDSVLALWMDEA